MIVFIPRPPPTSNVSGPGGILALPARERRARLIGRVAQASPSAAHPQLQGLSLRHQASSREIEGVVATTSSLILYYAAHRKEKVGYSPTRARSCCLDHADRWLIFRSSTAVFAASSSTLLISSVLIRLPLPGRTMLLAPGSEICFRVPSVSISSASSRPALSLFAAPTDARAWCRSVFSGERPRHLGLLIPGGVGGAGGGLRSARERGDDNPLTDGREQRFSCVPRPLRCCCH